MKHALTCLVFCAILFGCVQPPDRLAQQTPAAQDSVNEQELKEDSVSGVPINSQDALSNEACEYNGGTLRSIQNDGTACEQGEVDIGRVDDVKCKCQCCKPSA